jgi:sugar transferase (PEP-CTERM/EpsH1 system associated)
LLSLAHEPIHPKTYDVLAEYCVSVEIIRINSNLSTLRTILYFFTKKPLSLAAFYSAEFHAAVRRKLQRESFDLIYIYSSTMAQYALDAKDIPKLMDFIDLDSQKWFDYAAKTKHPMKAVYNREGITLRAFEVKVAAQCDQNLFTSPAELNIFRQIAPVAPSMTLPNGADLKVTPNPSYDRRKLVFVGAMDYFPNVDAMLYFSGEILPLIKMKIPDVQVFIVGRNPCSQIRALVKLKNVTVTGSVNEVVPYLKDAAASVIPLRIARGIQNKILEAMGHGVPVVTTTTALGGIEAEPGVHLLAADDPLTFAENTVAVLTNVKLRQMLITNSIELVKRKYTWDQTAKVLDRVVRNIAAGN